MTFKCISKIGVDILSFSSHVGTFFVSNINALRMLLSSQNINYNSANKFKCPLNTGNPEVPIPPVISCVRWCRRPTKDSTTNLKLGHLIKQCTDCIDITIGLSVGVSSRYILLYLHNTPGRRTSVMSKFALFNIPGVSLSWDLSVYFLRHPSYPCQSQRNCNDGHPF